VLITEKKQRSLPFLVLGGLIPPLTAEVGEGGLLEDIDFVDGSDFLEEMRDEFRMASTASRCCFLFVIKSKEAPTGLGSLPSLTSLLLRLPSAEDVELSKFFWLLLPSIDFFGPFNMLNFKFLWPSPSSSSERSLVLFGFAHLSFFLPELSFF
jgi:hypothetical protein